MPMKVIGVALACCMASLIAASAFAQTNESAKGASGDKLGDLAKKLNNPVADLIQVPFEVTEMTAPARLVLA